VGEDTATLPRGWQKRLVTIENENTRGVQGLCLEVHDLAVSKYIAGREKDLGFTRELARQGYTHKATLLERLATVKATAPLTRLVQGRIGRDFT
jgi:hypothetical protein